MEDVDRPSCVCRRVPVLVRCVTSRVTVLQAGDQSLPNLCEYYSLSRDAVKLVFYLRIQWKDNHPFRILPYDVVPSMHFVII